MMTAAALSSMLVFPQRTNAQLASIGTQYQWNIAEDIAPDDSLEYALTTYLTRFNKIVFWLSGGAAYVKIGAPDTTDWASRYWMKLEEGIPYASGADTPISRICFKNFGADTVSLYLSGTKYSPQF